MADLPNLEAYVLGVYTRSLRKLVDFVSSEEVVIAKSIDDKGAPNKAALVRLRKAISEIQKLCSTIRKESFVMRKYGVDESAEEKVADDAADPDAVLTCPKCGSAVERHGETRLCPKCGSEPFESE